VIEGGVLMKKVIFICILIFLTACSSNSEKEMDTIQQIDRNLSSIVNSKIVNKASSNPYDYITANSEEFNNIVSSKQITLNYFFDKFKDSDENGLKEYIMADACVKILGVKNTVQEWSTGREWYEKYIYGS
jgi:hypothetical protein